MSRFLPHQAGAFLTLAAVALPVACTPIEPMSVPLYPNAERARLPGGEIAQVSGPIAKIDGNDVVNMGAPFDLLPGCHLIELEHRLMANGFIVPQRISSGPPPIVTYALRMKAGARYVIWRNFDANGMWPGRILLSAREEQVDGTTTDLAPSQSAEDIRACHRWETAARDR